MRAINQHEAGEHLVDPSGMDAMGLMRRASCAGLDATRLYATRLDATGIRLDATAQCDGLDATGLDAMAPSIGPAASVGQQESLLAEPSTTQ